MSENQEEIIEKNEKKEYKQYFKKHGVVDTLPRHILRRCWENVNNMVSKKIYKISRIYKEFFNYYSKLHVILLSYY